MDFRCAGEPAGPGPTTARIAKRVYTVKYKLSLLQGTTPGQLTWNSTFVAQVVIYGLLPVLGLLGAQFPGQLNQAFSWVSSLARKS